ncbi:MULTISPECIES: flagellar filament capping protein FliD [Deefgea]|uniref:Flagellar filament capping protein FliD n=1 Tax=Deefgea chitinilytica TaxID=570276 RepID=A0ABS2CCX0_9NEIS|nr:MULTISPECIES: flagellar filament capping protein FliD [Deefgea]MBM5571994.1 flagellar filament capping protein FliD [Deefgea chitinilytica]MBM9889229.1 flagellar filament capping protein FliD [Deefgea sp. CFH1-16]
MLSTIGTRTDWSAVRNNAIASPAQAGGGGLSATQIYQINQLDAVRKIGPSALSASASYFSPQNNSSFNPGGSSDVRLSAAARTQSSLAEFKKTLETVTLNLTAPLQAQVSSSVSSSISNSDAKVLSAKALQGGKTQAALDIEVQQLAQSQQIQSKNFTPADVTVGTGKLTIQSGELTATGGQVSGGRVVTITIDGRNNTLAGIAEAINRSDAKVSAQVVRDASGSRLQLTGQETGAANAFTVSVQDGDDNNNTDESGLSALRFDAVSTPPNRLAQDAKLRIGERDVIAQSNTVSDSSSNLQLQLFTEGKASVALSRDSAAVTSKAVDLVANYNKVREQLLAIDDSSARRELKNLDDSFKGLSVNTGGERLVSADLGLSRDVTGKLFINETRLSQQALSKPEASNDLINTAVDKLSTQLNASLNERGSLVSTIKVIRDSRGVQAGVSSLLQSFGSGGDIMLNRRATGGIQQYLLVAGF